MVNIINLNDVKPLYGSVTNRLMEQATQQIVPAVGLGVTLTAYTDRDAGTITMVSANGKTLTIQEDTATRTDKNGVSDSQTYAYSPNPMGRTYTFTLRRNGRYYEKGRKMGQGLGLVLGYRDSHYDYSF